ncbi:MAG TPA: malto-oligosyltrehalose trehalohydrolase [Roseiflexaceae bacterium]|nr:malto-oligosyltrehalose trehalohydrolase [Roseiflexaceae bacterium]
MVNWALPIGACPDAHGVHFRVWANNANHVEVVLYDGERETGVFALQPEAGGYFAGHVAGVKPGARYLYRLDAGEPRPDPASRFQPDGVHGVSQVVDPAAFAWTDRGWRGIALEEALIYELHVGTATEAGTFDALIERLDDLRDLGVTAIELMPVADFPGERNWGYDGVNLFAPARAYGGPQALRRLVDAAHARGLAVLLDVVYNHLGPDGNYLRLFSREYFTDRHITPWGDALNFDGPGSPPVREFFVANACYWAHEYHLDGLRLDATHALIDVSEKHILAELAEAVHASLPPERHFLLIAENEHNDPNLVRKIRDGGWGMGDGSRRHPLPSIPHPIGLDGVWADDFHHQVRVALTHESEGYYQDYSGSAEDLAATMRQGWFFVGQRSTALGHPRGAPADDLPPPRFVYCIQNHDQVGNRALGERLNHDVALEAYRAASALLLLSPYTALLFMGQEWAASTPFLYFTDHDAELGRLVTEGRRAEFAGFTAFSGAQVPDPQARETFERSKLRWDERAGHPHAGTLQLYRDLISLRRSHPALRPRDRHAFAVAALGESALALRRTGPTPEDMLLLVVNLDGALRLDLAARAATSPPTGMRWEVLLDTESDRYGGSSPARFLEQRAIVELDGPAAVVLAAVAG